MDCAVETLSLEVGESERRYYLFRPTREETPLPLLIFLHGMGATPQFTSEETDWPAYAIREKFLLALPEASVADPTQPPKFLTNPPRWNDGSTKPGDPYHVEIDDVEFLKAVVHDAVARGADPNRVFMSGFSNGAGMAFRFASAHSELLAAIAPVAGHWWQSSAPTRPLPTLYMIGSADPLIPLQGGDVRLPWGGRIVQRPTVQNTLSRWAAAIGNSTAPIMIRSEASVEEAEYPGPTPFRAVTIEGLGHHWPGGKGTVNPRIVGNPSSAVNAAETVWDFLKRFHR